GGGGGEVCEGRPCSRPRCPQRPHDRAARTLPNPAEEFCGLGDRPHLQRSRWELVDRLTWPPYEISLARRASRVRITQPLCRAVSQSITTAHAQVKPADERPLDILQDRSADDHKESRDADFQSHA